jgi:hypothetical protein
MCAFFYFKLFCCAEEKYADGCKELSALRQLVIEKERLLVSVLITY